MSNSTILHIGTHLGGGVGRFYKNIFSEDKCYRHRYALLEEPIDTSLLPSKGSWFVVSSKAQLSQEVSNATIVQIEFWNHPLLYGALADIKEWPDCRLILYSHVSGLHPPAYLPTVFTKMVDVLILATPASKYTDAALSKNGQYEIIPEFGGASRTENVVRKTHKGFRSAYIGTASYLKVHPNIIKWFCEIHKENNEIAFVFCTQDSSSHLQSQVPRKLKNAFTFYERVDDVGEILSKSDVFGYPLQSRHYGTGEQALLEAMGSGLPTVVLDNPAERYIVDHGRTGIIARSGQEFIESILFLASHPNVAIEMGKNARQKVSTEMSSEVTRSRFHIIYNNLKKKRKRNHSLEINQEPSPWNLFLLSQGRDSSLFREIFKPKNSKLEPFLRWQFSLMGRHLLPSKGTLAHWHKYFPYDANLAFAKALMESVAS